MMTIILAVATVALTFAARQQGGREIGPGCRRLDGLFWSLVAGALCSGSLELISAIRGGMSRDLALGAALASLLGGVFLAEITRGLLHGAGRAAERGTAWLAPWLLGALVVGGLWVLAPAACAPIGALLAVMWVMKKTFFTPPPKKKKGGH